MALLSSSAPATDRNAYRYLSALFVVVIFSACTNIPRGVSWRADQACQMLFITTGSYWVTAEKIPGFIEPLIVYAAHQSLQRKGLVLADTHEEADLRTHLRFEMVSQDPPSTPHERADEVWMPGTLVRFNAIVWVEIKNKNQDIIWSGRLSRTHAIMGNETFHRDRAAIFLQQGFDALFENLLVPCIENQS